MVDIDYGDAERRIISLMADAARKTNTFKVLKQYMEERRAITIMFDLHRVGAITELQEQLVSDMAALQEIADEEGWEA